MPRKLHKYLLPVLSVITLGLLSCDDKQPDNSPNEPLELSRSSILVGNEATEIFIGVTARTAGWRVTGDEAWCRVTPASGDQGISQVTVTFTEYENENNEPRRTTLLFESGSYRKEVSVEQRTTQILNPNMDSEYTVNQEIHLDFLNEWYLWNEETKTTAADYNQSYKSFYENYLTYLNDNALDGNRWEFGNVPYLYSYITRRELSEANSVPLDFGMEFLLDDYGGYFVGRIQYVLPGSPAADKGLKRGNWFYKVNDVAMGTWESTIGEGYQYNRLIDSLVHPVAGWDITLGMLNFQSSSGRLSDPNRSVTLTPRQFARNPIVYEQIIGPGTSGTPSVILEEPVGYLVYNSFDPGYEQQLINVFRRFRENEGGEVKNLVLDLRYNKSGTVETAKLMADLIVPESARDKVFASYEFNSSQSHLNHSVRFDPHEDGLGLQTVYILIGGMTAGPAELLINGLLGIPDIRVILIGDITEGMNVGMVRRTFNHRIYPDPEDADEYTDYQYEAYAVAFRCYNANGEGDYRYGITPNITVEEWDTSDYTKLRWKDSFGWNGSAGYNEDQLLRTALDYIAGNEPLPDNRPLYMSSRDTPKYPREFSVQAAMLMEIETNSR